MMLDDIFVQLSNNFVKGFSGHEDILEWLREQWAGIFADALKKRQADIKIKSLEGQISELANIVASLKSYSEELVKTVTKDKSKAIITKVNKEFEDRKIRTFLREDLIRYIQDMEETLKPKEAFDKFMAADDLETFLKSINFREMGLARSERALRDFAAIKAQHSDGPASPRQPRRKRKK